MSRCELFICHCWHSEFKLGVYSLQATAEDSKRHTYNAVMNNVALSLFWSSKMRDGHLV